MLAYRQVCTLAGMDLPKRIEKARTHAGLVREDLAAKMKPRVTYETVRSWESGETTPRHKKLALIAEITGVRYEWLTAEAGAMLPGDDAPTMTPREVADRVRAMTREERMIWLQEIAKLEADN